MQHVTARRIYYLETLKFRQEVIDSVSCPSCFAEVGNPCVSVSQKVGTCELRVPHVRRVRKKRAKDNLMSEYIRIADPELFNTIINIAHCPVGTCLASLGDGCFRGSDVHKMRYDVAKGILDRRRIAKEIETGVGNDDRRMEYLIDKANTCTSLTCPTGPDCTDRCMAFAALEPSPYGLFQLKAPQVEEKAVSKKQALERQLDRILTEIDKLEAIGEDIYEDDTVLSIKLRYPNGEKEYDYIAFKSAGRWYLTGYQNAGPRSWEKMMEFFSHGELVGIWRVTEWEQIV